MKMKFKTTQLNPRALLYRRFTSLMQSQSLNIVYQTASTGQYWTFDYINGQFTLLQGAVPTGATITQVNDYSTVLQYKDAYYRFNGSEWQTTTAPTEEDITLLSASFNNIAKYQTNKYYYVGSFDWNLRGSVTGATAQYIKGAVTPFETLTIKYYTDDLRITTDDLVVISGKLFSVESTEMTEKHQPKRYNIYFATLNSIL